MKAILTVTLNGEGTDLMRLGTEGRFIVHAKTFTQLDRKVRKMANGRAYRVECFHDHKLYGEPFEILQCLQRKERS